MEAFPFSDFNASPSLGLAFEWVIANWWGSHSLEKSYCFLDPILHLNSLGGYEYVYSLMVVSNRMYFITGCLLCFNHLFNITKAAFTSVITSRTLLFFHQRATCVLRNIFTATRSASSSRARTGVAHYVNYGSTRYTWVHLALRLLGQRPVF